MRNIAPSGSRNRKNFEATSEPMTATGLRRRLSSSER